MRRLGPFGLVGALVACVCAPDAAAGAGASVEISSAAGALHDSLPADQAREAAYDFDDEERFDLRLAPFFLEGLALAQMNETSKARVGDLLEASLGPVGRKKADQIRGLEDEVLRQEEGTLLGWFAGLAGIRGDEAYFLSLYGDPAGTDPWGYRFDGHHLSINFTVVGDHVSPTPLFLGAQPRAIPAGGIGPAGLRVLAAEEDAARALYEALDERQRATATLPLQIGRGAFLGGDRIDPDDAPKGIAASGLTSEQRVLLDAVLEAYLQNVAPSIAARERARIDAAGREALHFAWAGSTTPGAEVYYRLHGPTVLIEFDNTVDDAEHIHTLWRDPSGDFGADLLRSHHDAAHAPRTKE